jgi:hypothetical protein
MGKTILNELLLDHAVAHVLENADYVLVPVFGDLIFLHAIVAVLRWKLPELKKEMPSSWS